MAASLPDQARWKLDIAGGVALWDVSTALPRKPHPRALDRRPPGAVIDCVLTHHSGRLGLPGWHGARASARYVVHQRRERFPGPAYHYWLPYHETRDPTGRLIIFRLCPDEERAWHTGGKANDAGVGVCWQGNLSRREPSTTQIELAEGLYPWLAQRFDAPAFGLHSEGSEFGGRAKASCPGPHVSDWVRRWREEFYG